MRRTSVAIAVAALAASCHAGRGGSGAAVPGEDELWVDPASVQSGMRVERAAVRDLPVLVAAAGSIDFDDLHVTHVFSPVTGRVARVLAQPGQRIRKGSPLVSIASPDVGAAFSDLVKAHADLLAAEADFDRQRRLAAVQAASARDVEAAGDVYRKAEAEYARTNAKARLLHPGTRDEVTQQYTLVSYLDGEVIARNVNPGQEVQGQYSGGSAPELFVIGDIRTVWAVADVPATELPRVRPGADLTVRVVAYPDRVFRGRVDHVADTLDPALRTVRVRATLDNADEALKPGMYAQIEIGAPPRRGLAVAQAAVTTLTGETFAWVRDGTRQDGRLLFRRRLVRVRTAGAGLVEVEQGLAAGDEVAVDGEVAKQGSTGGALLTPRQLERGGIVVAPAEALDFADAVSLGGRFAFDDLRVSHVFSPVTGRVTRVLVNPGDRVRRGTPLARILSPDVGTAVADVVKAQADLVQAEHEQRRQKELYESRAGARKDLEAAESAFRKATAELQRAREKNRLLGEGTVDRVTQELVLTSPLDGEVVARGVSPGTEVQGQYSGASSPLELFTVGDASRLWVLADAYEVDLPRIHEGDPVDLQIPALPGRTFQGRIEWISDVVDAQLRTVKVRCGVDNRDRALKPEMYEAVLVKVPGKQVVAVPRSAVLREGDDRVVIVEAGKSPDGRVRFERRVVVVDEGRAGGPVPVQAGLAPGERVVTRGALLVLGAM